MTLEKQNQRRAALQQMSSSCLAQDKPILQGTPSALSALEDEEQKGRRTPLYSGEGIRHPGTM